MIEQPQTFDSICASEDGEPPDGELIHFEKYDGLFDFEQDSGSFDIWIPVKTAETENHPSGLPDVSITAGPKLVAVTDKERSENYYIHVLGFTKDSCGELHRGELKLLLDEGPVVPIETAWHYYAYTKPASPIGPRGSWRVGTEWDNRDEPHEGPTTNPGRSLPRR